MTRDDDHNHEEPARRLAEPVRAPVHWVKAPRL